MNVLIKSGSVALGVVFLVCGSVILGEEDQALPYKPLQDELEQRQLNEFEGWNEEDFSRLDVNDPRLKRAYRELFGVGVGSQFYPSSPYMQAALADLKKRGNSVTPMFLKVMEDNPETSLEINILLNVSKVGELDLGPYLNYARWVLRERTMTMNATLVSASSMLLVSNGNESDWELLRWVAKTRPFVAYSVSRELDKIDRQVKGEEDMAAKIVDDGAGLTKKNTEALNDGETLDSRSDSRFVPQRQLILWTLGVIVVAFLIGVVVKRWFCGR